jgi:nitrogen PTS system EIIA component
MRWNIRETAQALRMAERDVLRLAREGELPACRVGDQYSFNAVDLQEWASRNDREIDPDFVPVPSELMDEVSLADAIERGGAHYGVPGRSKDEVLDAVSELPGIPDAVDRALVAEVLRSREGLASTGIGGGIAIPHPRDPLVLQVDSPIVLLCFLAQPVDFAAIDERPVRVLFTLLSPTISLHLRMLSRLAFVLHDEVMNRLLDARAPEDAILVHVRTIEARLENSKARR